ncbi:MAG TPA: fibronectin type III domain-containing protein [Acidimicrobiia bacterium]|nr:fibronectin type III domain-containing protein [Acidimicrobiia bacterium]
MPSAPTTARVTHTRGTTSASVIFTAPAGNGGSAIIRYNVSCAYPGLVTPRTAIGAGTTILVTGLVVGKVYTCTVTATNAVGTGAASAAVVFTA